MLELSKFKVFADDNLLTEIAKFVIDRVENIVGKGENAGYQHFLLYPQCFLSFSENFLIFPSHLICHLQILSIWTSLKYRCFGNGLNVTKNSKLFLLEGK